ncbi:MAG: hypothetical protein ACLP7P_06895 [Rhodomicrobium sp.]
MAKAAQPDRAGYEKGDGASADLERYTRLEEGDITNSPSSRLQQFLRLPGDEQTL